MVPLPCARTSEGAAMAAAPAEAAARKRLRSIVIAVPLVLASDARRLFGPFVAGRFLHAGFKGLYRGRLVQLNCLCTYEFDGVQNSCQPIIILPAARIEGSRRGQAGGTQRRKAAKVAVPAWRRNAPAALRTHRT